MPTSVVEQWQEVRRRVAEAARRSGREPEAIRVVGVTKTVPPEIVRAALGLGLTDLGENRVQEALAKQAVLGRTAATWHLIGKQRTERGFAFATYSSAENRLRLDASSRSTRSPVLHT